jgi:hypothetical protein
MKWFNILCYANMAPTKRNCSQWSLENVFAGAYKLFDVPVAVGLPWIGKIQQKLIEHARKWPSIGLKAPQWLGVLLCFYLVGSMKGPKARNKETKRWKVETGIIVVKVLFKIFFIQNILK